MTKPTKASIQCKEDTTCTFLGVVYAEALLLEEQQREFQGDPFLDDASTECGSELPELPGTREVPKRTWEVTK